MYHRHQGTPCDNTTGVFSLPTSLNHSAHPSVQPFPSNQQQQRRQQRLLVPGGYGGETAWRGNHFGNRSSSHFGNSNNQHSPLSSNKNNTIITNVSVRCSNTATTTTCPATKKTGGGATKRYNIAAANDGINTYDASSSTYAVWGGGNATGNGPLAVGCSKKASTPQQSQKFPGRKPAAAPGVRLIRESSRTPKPRSRSIGPSPGCTLYHRQIQTRMPFLNNNPLSPLNNNNPLSPPNNPNVITVNTTSSESMKTMLRNNAGDASIVGVGLRRGRSTTPGPTTLPGTDSCLNKISLEYSYEELSQSTQRFNADQRLGQGSYGSVYKGVLKDGTEIAVKLLKGPKEAGFEEEVKVLSKFRHPNLVILMGFARHGDSRLLVYEMLSGGDVGTRLNKGLHLDWRERLNIALDTGCGLSHLHNSTPKVFHRDIKSGNILLDRNGSAKVADFGLACLSKDGDRNFIVKQTAGTVGYADPKYITSGVVNEKTEVYSFGMVLIELFTGCPPAVQNFDSSITYLLSYIGNTVNGLLNLVDRSANFPLVVQHQLAPIIFRCISDDDTERPDFRSLVRELRSLVTSANEECRGRNLRNASVPAIPNRSTTQAPSVGSSNPSSGGSMNRSQSSCRSYVTSSPRGILNAVPVRRMGRDAIGLPGQAFEVLHVRRRAVVEITEGDGVRSGSSRSTPMRQNDIGTRKSMLQQNRINRVNTNSTISSTATEHTSSCAFRTHQRDVHSASAPGDDARSSGAGVEVSVQAVDSGNETEEETAPDPPGGYAIPPTAVSTSQGGREASRCRSRRETVIIAESSSEAVDQGGQDASNNITVVTPVVPGSDDLEYTLDLERAMQASKAEFDRKQRDDEEFEKDIQQALRLSQREG